MVRTPGVETSASAAPGAARAPRRGERLRHLEVGRVLVAVGEGDGVFAGLGQHVEFLRDAATDAARVGTHRAESELHAFEDAGIGRMHRPVALLQRGLVDVEGVGVLHHELTRPHDAEARSDLVAELGLDLIEVHRELAVALELAACDVGDHFLVRGSETERPVVAVREAQQLGPELVPAPRFLPELRRLHHRHYELDRARAIHLLADDGFDLAQHAQPHRQPGIQARRQTPDESRPQHELVAHDLGIRRHVAQGVDRIAAESHWAGPVGQKWRGMLAEPRRRSRRCAGRAAYL